jgi:hypothetical protein
MAPINSPLLTITLYNSVMTTLVYKEIKPFHDVIIEFRCSFTSALHEGMEGSRDMDPCILHLDL